MVRILSQTNPPQADATTERCLAALSEVLEDIRAQVYSTNPQLAQLVRLARQLAGVAMLRREELAEVLDDLRAYEERHLNGHARYTQIMRDGQLDPAQLRWDW